MASAGVQGPKAGTWHFALVRGSAQVMLPALGVAPPFWEAPATETAIDALHHAVYVSATGAVYAALDR